MYRIDENKIREVVAQSNCQTVRVHPEGVNYYAGVVLRHGGKWDEKNLAILRNHTQTEPFQVSFCGFASFDYCEVVREGVACV